jgi:hypothetical protein
LSVASDRVHTALLPDSVNELLPATAIPFRSTASRKSGTEIAPKCVIVTVTLFIAEGNVGGIPQCHVPRSMFISMV